ncbi:MAG TPA: transposase, partial [Myxococcaceae bacterium]|nr:transposase [Myxococcaceae bacterium]
MSDTSSSLVIRRVIERGVCGLLPARRSREEGARMGWPLRRYESSLIYFVTVRCLQGRLLLRPSKETNEVIGGVLSRAIRRTEVELFVFSFASNHLHLLVRAPRGNLPEFMQYLLGNISRKVGRVVGWQGAFWERRYSAEPVLDEAALLERVRYILSHGVKEGLVRTCNEWPGLNSLPEMLGEPARTFSWFNWSQRWLVRSSTGVAHSFDRRFVETETLSIAPLPLERLAKPARWRHFLARALRAIERQGRREHRRVLGRAGVLDQDPQHRPERPKRSRRPWCHAGSKKLRRQFMQAYEAFRAAFIAASTRWRAGDLSTVFPEGSYR